MLTQLKVQNAEHRDRPYKLADGSGLYLFVSPTAKLWRLKYRFAGKEKVLSIRMYPEVSLATARIKRDDARALLRDGIDPGEQKKADRVAAKVEAGNTFGIVAKDYLDKLRAEGRSEATLDKNTWLLLDLAKPLAERPVTQIKPAEILTLLKQVERTGRRESAHRLRIQQSLEPRYSRKTIYHLTIAGQNQCLDLEEELLSFPKSPNDDTSDSAAYQSEMAQPPAGAAEGHQVAEIRRRLAQNQSR